MTTSDKTEILLAVALEMDRHLSPLIARLETLERRISSNESRIKQLDKEHSVLAKKLATLEAQCRPS